MAINFHIKTKNCDLTPEITRQVHEKLGGIDRFMATHDDQEILAEIEVGLRTTKHQHKDDLYRSEINVSTDGNVYRAVAKEPTLTASLDTLKDEIEKVIRRKTTKKQDLGRKGGRLLKKLFRRGE